MIGDDLIGMSIGFPAFGQANAGLVRQMAGLRAMRYASPFYGDRTGMMARGAGYGGRAASAMSPFMASEMSDQSAVPYMQMSQSPEGRQAANQFLGQFGMQALDPAQASPF